MTSSSSTKILVTGSNGFIGKNLIFQAKERLNFEIDTFTRKNSDKTLKEKLLKADFLIHLAGENRPETDDQFRRRCSSTCRSRPSSARRSSSSTAGSSTASR